MKFLQSVKAKVVATTLAMMFAVGAFAQDTSATVPAEATAAFEKIEAQAEVWATSAITWVAGIVGAVIVVFLMLKAIRWVKRAINSAS